MSFRVRKEIFTIQCLFLIVLVVLIVLIVRVSLRVGIEMLAQVDYVTILIVRV